MNVARGDIIHPSVAVLIFDVLFAYMPGAVDPAQPVGHVKLVRIDVGEQRTSAGNLWPGLSVIDGRSEI